VKLRIDKEQWPYRVPFRTARGLAPPLDVVVVFLADDAGHAGRGEAAGVDYQGETAASMEAQIEALRAHLEQGITRAQLADLLPAGGARNAVDCALWDLEAKSTGVTVWARAGCKIPHPVPTCVTIGIGSTEEVLDAASRLRHWPRIKIKVDATHHVDVIRSVRKLCPDAALIIDANQGWTCEMLNDLVPELEALDVLLIEQPVLRANESSLKNYAGTIPLAADESCIDRASMSGLGDLYQAVNIKLDKAGGLTEALAMAEEARQRGLLVMVGCMAGTSLAMAPGMVVAQSADFADLDGPLLHSRDRDHAIHYEAGVASVPSRSLWG
jgi:L-alanine-DL-glutamate epimerase-like enolase superfamily enzyme